MSTLRVQVLQLEAFEFCVSNFSGRDESEYIAIARIISFKWILRSSNTTLSKDMILAGTDIDVASNYKLILP